MILSITLKFGSLTSYPRLPCAKRQASCFHYGSHTRRHDAQGASSGPCRRTTQSGCNTLRTTNRPLSLRGRISSRQSIPLHIQHILQRAMEGSGASRHLCLRISRSPTRVLRMFLHTGSQSRRIILTDYISRERP